MCGIIAVLGVHKGAETIYQQVVERARRIYHRGPDYSGVYVKGSNILAHQRLAIIDVETGHQPLYNEKKDVILAVNGEIYNHKILRKNLKEPGTFLTESDCEVILHLYHEHDENFLNQLNGIFAFVLVDETRNRYIIARDHMGICPLYMGRDADGATWVASELKALHDVCVTFQDFPPGHCYVSDRDEFIKWYNPKWHDEDWVPTPPLDLIKLREQFEAAVTRQLMSDVPYGVLLSGGLDSSLVSSIVSRICSTRSSGHKIRSFSIGLAGSPDLIAARQVAEYLGTQHYELHFTVEEGIAALSDVIYHLETYDTTTIRASTPMYLMSHHIRDLGVKMVLSGEGSDEMFGGYLYFHKCPNKEEFQKETVRKLKALHKYDCLRANKSTPAWSVEARVPFLDKEFLDYAMTEINPLDKMCGRHGSDRMEKWCLREAFKGYLPDHVLWRQKEQFSDGVGYSWIDGLKAYAEKQVSDIELANAKHRFPHNTPQTKENFLFRSIFEKHFPQQSAREAVPGGPSIACSTPTALLWDASFQKYADASGRAVAGVHNAAYTPDSSTQPVSAVVEEQIVKAVVNTLPTTVIDMNIDVPPPPTYITVESSSA